MKLLVNGGNAGDGKNANRQADQTPGDQQSTT